MPRHGIAGSFYFWFFKQPWYSHLWWLYQFRFTLTVPRVPFSPHSHAYLLFIVFVITAILTGMRWYLIVVLNFIFLMISGVDYVFMCLLVICMSSLEKCLFRSSEWVSEVAQSCLTLCNPMDCSLPGSSVHGIFQAWILEWGAISFSKVPTQIRLF